VKDTDIIAAIAPDAVSLMDKAIAEIKRLRQENATLTAERDEARREICMNATKEPYRQMCGSGILLPQDAARERGWDCYKEDGK
jgi:hypothetical protein